jgi:hypothetical protein
MRNQNQSQNQNRRTEPRQESSQATLARVKKEMDQPRMVASAREDDVNRTTRQKLEKLP